VARLAFGRPQLYAALLLLLFLVQALWIVENTPGQPRDFSMLDCGRAVLHLNVQSSCTLQASPIAAAAAASPFLFVRSIEGIRTSQLSVLDLFRFAPWTQTIVRLPFVLFGLWLGGGLWWVSRRLFGTSGGLIALSLYCTSPWMLRAASGIAPEIIAAWGFFGAIYTAIGIGHTILAPVAEWRMRILLLGAALGFTIAAVPPAGWVAIILSAVFLLYVAENRRLQALRALCVACLIALAFVLVLTAGRIQLLTAATPFLSWRWIWRFFSQAADVPLYVLTAIALATFLGWKRARYFGNWSPLLVAAIAPFIAVRWTGNETLVWTLPFLFVFIAGVFADLLETSFRLTATCTVITLILANAGMGWLWIMRSVALLRTLGSP